MTLEELRAMQAHKRAPELLIERIFKPEKYPAFHKLLDEIHEEWILSWRKP